MKRPKPAILRIMRRLLTVKIKNTMTKTEELKACCKQLKLTGLSEQLEDLINEAQTKKSSYTELMKSSMEKEILHREKRAKERRIKYARLPMNYNLDLFDFEAADGIEKQQLNQLRELNWLEQNFNIILMGPSGIGKTYIAAGLCFDAVEMGYKAYFKTIEQLIKVLKMKEVTRSAGAEYRRILKSHLLVIDDIMMFPVTHEDAVAFFNLINELHDKTSIIITTNKSPKQWVDVLKDSVLTTALLDRLLHRCEVIKLKGNSYRMKNREKIFDTNNK